MPLRRLLLLAAVSLSAATSPAADPISLRVLCYNIHYGQGMDGVYDIPRLAEVIKAAKPDLVALQEVDVGVRRSGERSAGRGSHGGRKGRGSPRGGGRKG
jgi:endonuclease/exonuclease/phosphatase family metal-dependent hydrolase